MADLWFRKFGFSRNPFSIKPAAFSYDLVGASIDGVLSGIEEGKLIFVEAPLGYGKTTLLKSIINRYGGKRKVVYAHALHSESLDVKGLLKRSSIARFITGSLPKGMIMVVDESQNIQGGSADELAEFYKNGNIKSVIFFGTKYNKDVLGSSLGETMNGNVIRLSKPTPEQAISLVRSRVGGISILSNDDILSAYKKAQGSPRRLLQLCEDICRKASEGESTAIAALQEVESELVSSTEPELSQPVGEVSRVSDYSLVAVPAEPKPKPRKVRRAKEAPIVAVKNEVAVPIIRPARKHAKPKAKKAHAAIKKSIKRSRQPSAASRLSKKSPAAKLANPEAAPEQEGVYWGEFMGMQK